MDIVVGQLKNVEVKKTRDGNKMIVKLTELDGSYYGCNTEIKLPANSYEMLEDAIVNNWLEKNNS